MTHIMPPPSGNPHTHTAILLHGRDSNPAEFAAELFESEASTPSAGDDDSAARGRTLPELFPGVRWVFPSAKPRPSARFGVPLRQWFDMWSTERPAERPELQADGLRESSAQIAALLEQEAKLVPLRRIMLGGISQGYATALFAFLVGEPRVRLAGLLGLSSWAPPPPSLLMVPAKEGRSSLGHSVGADDDSWLATPVILGHCADDEVVPLANGQELRDALLCLGMRRVEWHEYPDGGHWINEPNGVDDVVAFLRRVFVVADAAGPA